MLEDALFDRVQPLFREKNWAELQRLVEDNRDPTAQYLLAWSLLARGLVEKGLPLMRALLDRHGERTLVGPSTEPWSTWHLRQKLGATKIRDWGLLPALVKLGWEAMATHPFHSADPFVKDWVSPDLATFLIYMPPTHRHPTPWQLGGAMSVSSDHADARVRDWVVNRAATLVALTEEEQSYLEALGLGRARPPATRPFLMEDDEAARPLAVFHAAQRRDVDGRGELLRTFGRMVAALPPERARQVCADVDAFLQIEDLWERIPKPQRARGAHIRKVLFRATPMRVVDTAIAALHEPGMFGTLARKAGPEGAALVWFEGTKDEALATVPDEHFKEAVTALQEPPGRA